MANKRFNSSDFWKRRLGPESDLTVVGHRSFGKEYNRHIYSARSRAILEFLTNNGGPGKDADVLDIGCGTGYYRDLWKSLRTKSYTGVDLSDPAIQALKQKHPDDRFQVQDITRQLPESLPLHSFDIITVFDVFYHIVDDRLFHLALSNVGRLIRPGGLLLVFEQLARNDYSPSAHVKFRNRTEFMRCASANRFTPVHTRRLFQLLVPPMFALKLVDVPVAGAYKLAGYLTTKSEPFGRLTGSAMLRLDQILLRAGLRLPNNDFICFKAE